MAPLQAKAAGPAVVQRKPSTEVPDLDESVVKAVNEALGKGDHEKAMSLILDALEKKDPKKYDKTKLVGNKLHKKRGNALTRRGPKFKAWLKKMLDAGGAEIKKGEKEMQKYLDGLTPPEDSHDFRVEIGSSFFNNASHLYSTIMHEFIHVDQARANPMKAISSADWPEGYDKPSHSTEIGQREFEAYTWEEQNLAGTGLGEHPDDVWNLFKQLADHGPLTSDTEGGKRWRKSLANLFDTAFSKYLSRSEALIKTHATTPLGKSDMDKVKDNYRHMESLWRYTRYRTMFSDKFKTRYEAVEKFVKNQESEAAAKTIIAEMKAAQKKMAGGSSWDGYNAWINVYDKWMEISEAKRKELEPEAKKILPVMWAAAFDMLVADIEKRWKADKDDRNIVHKWNGMSRMITRADDSLVDAETKKVRKAKLDEWDKKIEDHRAGK